MWSDGQVETFTCPVLAFTPDVQEAMQWFAWTHELDVEPMTGSARWRLARLPRDGGLADQDARTMAMLAYLREIANQLVYERRVRADKEREIAEWRQSREAHAAPIREVTE